MCRLRFWTSTANTISRSTSAPPPIDHRFVSLGKFRFDESGQWYILISNEGTDGHVIVDALQLLPAESREPKAESRQPKPVAAKPER